MFDTGIQEYLLLINNKSELDDVKHQLDYDLNFYE